MADPIRTRVKNAWNVFRSRDPTHNNYYRGYNAQQRPDRPSRRTTSTRSVVVSIYNRIALDVSANVIQHVRTDQNGRYLETVDSGLNYCLTAEANIDQTSRAFIQDIVMSMFDEGVVAVVPVDTYTVDASSNSDMAGTEDILTMRTGKVVDWFPKHVRIRLYNENSGKHEEVTVPKDTVAIIENPLYSVMNEPNSTLKRLLQKLTILDAIDEQSGAGKLDLIIQLPHIIKTPARREQAEQRRKDIELQLAGSKYGIAYTDGTERVTQLNRPAENNLMAQIQYLTSMLYSQLGLTEDVFIGKADEATMLNYNNRTVALILNAIIDELKRKFLTRDARAENQSIMYFRDAFSLVPVNELANVADKFTRNEILSSNEVRAIIGLKPSEDPRADELRNKNLNAPKEDQSGTADDDGATNTKGD